MIILSYEQIRKVLSCPDCARRAIEIETYANSDQLAIPFPEELRGLSVHAIEVLHDPGCPRIMYDPTIRDKRVIEIHPVAITEDHPWVLKLQEMES